MMKSSLWDCINGHTTTTLRHYEHSLTKRRESSPGAGRPARPRTSLRPSLTSPRMTASRKRNPRNTSTALSGIYPPRTLRSARVRRVIVNAAFREQGDTGGEVKSSHQEFEATFSVSTYLHSLMVGLLLGDVQPHAPAANPLAHIQRVKRDLDSWREVTKYIGAPPEEAESVRQTAGAMMRDLPREIERGNLY